MNYSIRQTVGDSTVEISGETAQGTFDLYQAVEKHGAEKQPKVSDALLRQMLDTLDEVNEMLKGTTAEDGE